MDETIILTTTDEKTNEEIESKFPIADRAKLHWKILSLHPEVLADEIYELNLLLDRTVNPLEDDFQRLRLRLQGTVVTLTYKRSLKKEDGVAYREEIETEVEDFENMKLILERLGYHTHFVYEKYRSVFKLDDCVLMLDDTPIGTYLEIESASLGQIKQMAQRLEVDPDAAMATGYHQLFMEWKAAVGADMRDMLFRD